MIPPAYPCGASRYVKEMIKICEWVKNEMSAINLLCSVARAAWMNKHFNYAWITP